MKVWWHYYRYIPKNLHAMINRKLVRMQYISFHRSYPWWSTGNQLVLQQASEDIGTQIVDLNHFYPQLPERIDSLGILESDYMWKDISEVARDSHRELIPLGFLKVRSRALLIKGCQRRGDIYRSEQQHPRWQAGRVQEIGDTATHTWADPPTPSDVYQGVPRVTPALLTCAFVWPQHFQYQPLHEFSISYGDSETLHMQKVIVLNQSLALTKRWSGRLCDLKSAAHLRTDSSVRKSSSNMSTSAPLELCTSHIPAD